MLLLSSHINAGRYVHIERNRPSEPRLNGYLLASSYSFKDGKVTGGLALMHPFDDFEPDGFTVIQIQDITAIQCGTRERLWDTMLRGESLLSALDRPPKIDLGGMKAVVESIASQFQYLIVHCEDLNDRIQDFYLGEPVSIDVDAIHFRCLNSLARWEDEPATIRLDEITKVEFETPYIKRFTKYIGA
jgi:hypothetical protein